MRKIFTWLRSHSIATTIAVVVAMVAGIHFFANWRSETRWNRYCEAARARGVKLTLAEFAPPEIPDAENFAALPMFRAIFHGGVQRPMEFPKAEQRPSMGNRLKGERLDWDGWRKLFKDADFIADTGDSAPRDVLLALDHYAPQVAEWREWKSRPKCRFPLDLKAGFAMPLPHLGSIQDAGKLFALRMRAHLALGDSAAAYEDFRDGLQGYRALSDEPTMISGLVQLSVMSAVLSAAGEGLASHAWAEAELQKIDADLGRIRMWEDYRRTFSSERGFGNWMYDLLADSSPAKRGNLLSTISAGTGGSPAGGIAMLFPKRVFRDNQLRANQYFDEVLARVAADGSGFDPRKPVPSGPESLVGFDQYYYFLVRISLPVFSTIEERFILQKTQLDQARIAIAIERFRTAHGELPQAIADLVPAFLAEVPLDTYSGAPMIYRRKDDGTWLLYSVGPDGRDGGGESVDRTKDARRQADWVWPYSRE